MPSVASTRSSAKAWPFPPARQSHCATAYAEEIAVLRTDTSDERRKYFGPYGFRIFSSTGRFLTDTAGVRVRSDSGAGGSTGSVYRWPGTSRWLRRSCGCHNSSIHRRAPHGHLFEFCSPYRPTRRWPSGGSDPPGSRQPRQGCAAHQAARCSTTDPGHSAARRAWRPRHHVRPRSA